MFDFNSLTGREISMIEDLSGVSISRLSDDEAPKGKFLSAIYFVARRRENPGVTFNECWDTRVDAQNEYLGLNETDEEDEVEAGESDASEKPARKTKRS